MPIQFIPRLLLLSSGLGVLSLGVAFSIRSNLGTSPISSLPYAFSFIVPLSVGTLTIIHHVLMILLQMIVLGKKFQWIQWLQLPVGIIFGIFIDATLWLTQSWIIENYFIQLLFCLLSCVLTAIGVCMVLRASLIYLAAEGLFFACAERFNKSFGFCKTIGDISLVLLAAISSYLYLGHVVGVREGTIITALFVGTMVKFLMPYFNFLDFTQAKVAQHNHQPS